MRALIQWVSVVGKKSGTGYFGDDVLGFFGSKAGVGQVARHACCEKRGGGVHEDDVAARGLGPWVHVLGYRDEPWRDALEGFEADAREQQRAVRSIHERLFFAPLLDYVAEDLYLATRRGSGS